MTLERQKYFICVYFVGLRFRHLYDVVNLFVMLFHTYILLLYMEGSPSNVKKSLHEFVLHILLFSLSRFVVTHVNLCSLLTIYNWHPYLSLNILLYPELIKICQPLNCKFHQFIFQITNNITIRVISLYYYSWRVGIINYCSPRRFYINNRTDPMPRGMGALAVTYNFVDLLQSPFEY